MRSLREPGVYIITATALCGLVDAPAWLAVSLAVIGLQAMSLPRYIRLFDSARSAGAEARWWRVVCLSIGFACLAAMGAYVLGAVIGRLWGAA